MFILFEVVVKDGTAAEIDSRWICHGTSQNIGKARNAPGRELLAHELERLNLKAGNCRLANPELFGRPLLRPAQDVPRMDQ